MEQLTIEVAKAVPALLVLAWVVNRFLVASKERDDAFHETASALTATIKENNQMLGRVEQALETVEEDNSKTRRVLHETQEALRVRGAA